MKQIKDMVCPIWLKCKNGLQCTAAHPHKYHENRCDGAWDYKGEIDELNDTCPNCVPCEDVEAENE